MLSQLDHWLLQKFLIESFDSEAHLFPQKCTMTPGLLLICFEFLLSSVKSLVQTSTVQNVFEVY